MSTSEIKDYDDAREAIVEAIKLEYERDVSHRFDPFKFGEVAAPLVNALAAISLIEKHQPKDPGAASRTDD